MAGIPEGDSVSSCTGNASAMLVVFIESLADFGNPLVLAGSGYPTLAVRLICRLRECMT